MTFSNELPLKFHRVCIDARHALDARYHIIILTKTQTKKERTPESPLLMRYPVSQRNQVPSNNRILLEPLANHGVCEIFAVPHLPRGIQPVNRPSDHHGKWNKHQPKRRNHRNIRLLTYIRKQRRKVTPMVLCAQGGKTWRR